LASSIFMYIDISNFSYVDLCSCCCSQCIHTLT
jgi:hypothetical protein